MKKLFSYIRLSEWYDSKVPLMMGALMYFYYLDMQQYSAEQFLVRFIAYMLYISLHLATLSMIFQTLKLIEKLENIK